jgi:hypothetical protein
MKVQIQGEMQFGSWVDKETGKKRSSIDMCAQHIWHIQGGGAQRLAALSLDTCQSRSQSTTVCSHSDYTSVRQSL